MRQRSALVVGGGGPTGPLVVDGLLSRGFAVTVLNTGRHPALFAGEVERIVADPHFAEPLEAALRGRSFDVAVAQYGRLKLVASALADRAAQVIAISTRAYPGWLDPSSIMRPTGDHTAIDDLPLRHHDGAMPVAESTPLEPIGKFGARIVEADRTVRDLHAAGAFSATILRYPRLYGPRQGGAIEWSILRRLIDGRRRLLAPEGGFLIRSMLFNDNAARIALAAVDRPEIAAGEIFNCADDELLTQRAWMQQIAAAFGGEIELISVPMAMASPAWAYARYPLTVGHQILDTAKLASLGVEMIAPADALLQTVRWYLEDPARGQAAEAALPDDFDYALEDRIIAELARAGDAIRAASNRVRAYEHPLAHPKQP